MNLNKIIRILIGKPDFQLSREVPIFYIFNKGLTFVSGLIRGFLRKYNIKKSGKKFFVGKKVKLRMKSKLVIGNNVRIDDYSVIDALSINGVLLGDRVKIGENSKILCSGSLSNIGVGLEIGADSSFSENTFFGAAGGIKIGNDVISGQNVRFHSENHNYSDKTQLIRKQGVSRQGIQIGNDCWIGSGVVFLDGTIVQDGCIIGANAVVKGNFGPDSVIAGMPAKVVKER